jgi:hypothetical protein
VRERERESKEADGWATAASRVVGKQAGADGLQVRPIRK